MLPKSLQRLLSHIIDYAGIYPPAALSLQESFANYVRYKQESENWIVRHFVCPAEQLDQLPPRPQTENPIPLCVIGSRNDGEESFREAVESDLRSMDSFIHETTGYLLQTYEVKVPNASVKNRDVQRLSRIVTEQIKELPIYLEIPFVEDWQTVTPFVISSLKSQSSVFPKIRTGGTKAEDFPSSEQVALFLETCATSQMPFKATAGLHHPLRHFDEINQCMMHGFLNVAVAFALCVNKKIATNVLIAVLEETEKTKFGFDDGKISWQGVDLDLNEIDWSRQMFGSFGSCSVYEPLQDLREWGYF